MVVEIITAVLGSGVIIALITTLGAKHKNKDDDIKKGEVAAAESSDPAIRYLARALTETQGKLNKVETELAIQRERGRVQELSIVGLRKIVHSWAEWGRWLHDEWGTLRHSANPPDLPNTRDEYEI